MTTPHFASLSQISRLIRDRKLSPVELVESCLERINCLQPRLNAFITVASGEALRAVAEAEKEIQDGGWKGPLHGVPIGIKDFHDTAGIRTTAAFAHFRNRIPAKDAIAVEKLKNAGAIVIGKTNMHTLGGGTTGLESAFGPAINPWNADYIPGGSSSGSAAAVAAGLCYATLDTDAIGSCRLPAACCGVVGFKPSYGLVSMQGILEGEKPPDEQILWLSHVGITARSAEDASIVLRALSGVDPKADRPLRLGVANNYRACEQVRGMFEQAVDAMRVLGHSIENAPAPFVSFGQGVAKIAQDREAIARLSFSDIDVLVLPTTPTTTPLVRGAANPLALSAENTMFANYYGLPAISIPCGFDKNGMPLGLQIVAGPDDEAAVLQLARQFQSGTAFHESHPSV
jgi:aspartyl-tRNA(Asn)/glutamyl-tRNA(Gln) amidotransferase subunit A